MSIKLYKAMEAKDLGNMFAIPDLSCRPRYCDIKQEPSSILFSELVIHDDSSDTKLPDMQPDEGFFVLPGLPLDNSGDLPTADKSDEFGSRVVESLPSVEEDQSSDIWAFSSEKPLEEAKYLSWDSFEDQFYEELPTPYITETGPQVFDAALADASDMFGIRNVDYIIIESRVYASSLLALGLGRSSVLFRWNEGSASFEPRSKQMRISGCTKETVDGVLATFMICGNATKALEDFVDRTYINHKSPCWIALGDVVSTLLSTLQCQLNVPISSLNSILQLQKRFKPAEELLTCFRLIIRSVAWSESHEAMLSQLFKEIQRLEYKANFMRDILLEVLARVSRPFLNFAGAWMGLENDAYFPLDEIGREWGFVRVHDSPCVEERLEKLEPGFIFDVTLVPSFFPVDDARTIYETSKSLHFLKTYHSNHVLARADIISHIKPPKLEWAFSWQNVEEIQAKALQYESNLKTAIREFSGHGSSQLSHIASINDNDYMYRLDVLGKPKDQIEAHILRSIEELSQSRWSVRTTDKLSDLLSKSLTDIGENPVCDTSMLTLPMHLTPFLSFSPIIAAQARVVNGVSMRLFFQKHSLREHLSIQRRFQLLGDGVFSSRLSHILFDTEVESAERGSGAARGGEIMGLQLGGRDTWPPASSELRLALMSVLTESYLSTASCSREQAGCYSDRTKDVPGDLSFAIRDMSDEEIERCIDPNSVEALDFLRISYKPPPPVEVVLTPASLDKYDQIFRLLLRVSRMLYVVTQLVRDASNRMLSRHGVNKTALRFRAESHHFISCVSAYFFDTGIDITWKIFERMLDRIAERINNNDELVVLGHHEGIDKLREYHERVLDRIMFVLLLRKRQQPVMNLLDDIFTLILQFAKYSRSHGPDFASIPEQDGEVKDMYLKFRRKVEVFIAVCKGLSEKKGYAEDTALGSQGMEPHTLFNFKELAEESTIAHLLARFEMSDYYSKAS